MITMAPLPEKQTAINRDSSATLRMQDIFINNKQKYGQRFNQRIQNQQWYMNPYVRLNYKLN